MLEQIYIKNFVIVDELTIDFKNGLSVLTGETGAGKSIWVDAVMLALGARADNQVIRSGTPQCDIVLTFNITNQPKAQAWLTDHDFDNETNCMIRRTLKADGKSRSTINGVPCSQQLIQKFSEHLISIQNQNHQQQLLKKQYQREQLDHISGIKKELNQLQELYNKWNIIDQKIKSKTQQAGDHSHELSFLQYQLNELNELNLQKNEWQELSQEHQSCHQAKNFISNLSQALEALSDHPEHNAEKLIYRAISYLDKIPLNNDKLETIKNELNTANIHLKEARNDIQSYRDRHELSPERLDEIERRLEKIHELSRKHHCPAHELESLIPSIEHKINELNNIDTDLETLKTEADEILLKYKALCHEVTRQRRKHSKIFSQKITQTIQNLNFKGGRFSIELQESQKIITAYGNETVEFYLSANPGQPAQPLHKAASGGELSRINLAIQAITAAHYPTPTLIFDEVDSGIGGETAHVVADLLQKLGNQSQVLCITHLPQVAAKGHQHFHINKKTTGNTTLSSVMQLNDKQRIQEVARMLGGQTALSKSHAEEMLAATLQKSSNCCPL